MSKHTQPTLPDRELVLPELVLPEQVTIALGELAGAAREGLLALAVGTGLQVMTQLMEADVTAMCGPKGKHDPTRETVRHGSEAGSVTLGAHRRRRG